jgi:putative ABC transport system permease protein
MQDFALMQCAGMDDRGVQLLVFSNTLIVCGVGGIVGIAAGAFASPLVTGAFSEYSNYLQQVRIEYVEVHVATLVAGILVCLTVAALASLPHALRARTAHPLDLLRTYSSHPMEHLSFSRVALGAVVCAGTVAVSWLSTSIPSAVRLGLAVLAGLGGIGFVGMHVLAPLARALPGQLSRFAPVASFVGLSQPPRSAPLAASLVLLAAVMFAASLLIVVVETIVESMGADIAARYSDGALVLTISSTTPVAGPLISPETIRAIRATPKVKDVAEYYDVDILVRGDLVTLRALDSRALFRNATMLAPETPLEEIEAALARGELVMSTSFGRWFDVQVGDEITLDTPSGGREFRVGGRTPGFTDQVGGLLIDLQTFDQHFHRRGASFAGIWAEGPLQDTLDEVSRRTAGLQDLFFESGAQLRQTVRHIADRFSGLLYTLLALGGFLAAIGVLAVVATAIVARAPELALMQIAGATPSSVTALIVLDATLLVAVGAAPGSALGILTADIVCESFETTFGWALLRHLAPGKLLAVSVGLFACAAAAALGPAWIASRRELSGSLPRQ